MLLRIAIHQLLDDLSESERVMVALYYQITEPSDYVGPWPPTFASVADYVGRRFDGEPLPESTVRYRMRGVLERWRLTGGLNP